MIKPVKSEQMKDYIFPNGGYSFCYGSRNSYKGLFLCLMILFLWLFPTHSYSKTYYLDVGETQDLEVPGVFDHVTWNCDNANVVFLEKTDVSAKIKIASYFDKAATVTLYCVTKYLNNKGWTCQYTSVYYYSIQCKSNAPVIVPSVLTMKVGETYQLHISPSTYESQAVWTEWSPIQAEVSDNGIVTAEKEGVDIIFATIPGLSSPLTCTVYVKDPKLSLKASKSSGTIERGTKITLTASKASARIYYTLDGTSPQENGDLYTDGITITQNTTLKAIAYDDELEPSDVLTRTYSVVDPKISLTSSEPSGTVDVGTRIYLISSVSDATIYYTTDGSTPTENSTVYQEPIVINDAMTIKAIAVCESYQNSDILTLNYSVKTVSLSVSPTESNVLAGTKITLTVNPINATIYYTTDGSEPTTNSNVYSAPIIANENLILRAKAYCNGYKASELVQYYIVEAFTAKSTYPVQNGRTKDSHIIPYVKYDYAIQKGEKFNDIQLLNEQNYIAGKPFIVDNMLYFVPDNPLSPDTYTLFIPEKAVVQKKKYNIEMTISFLVTQHIETKPMIALCSCTSLALKNDGSLWSWGYNYYGQLGDGTTTNRSSPTKVLDDVVSVAAGTYDCCFAIKSNGSLWAWGHNFYGQLGDGTTTNRSSPVKILDDVVIVKNGNNFSTFAIKNDGSLWAWGYNYYGQLGDGTTTNRASPVKVLDNVVSVAAGSSQTLAIKSDGSLWAWGDNEYGQLGNGTTTDCTTPVKILDGVISAAIGWGQRSFAIKSNGSLWAWGRNDSSVSLGDGTSTNRTSPVKILDNVTSIVTCNKVFIDSGSADFAIKNNGSIWAWGYNKGGQIGDGTTTNRKAPISVLNNVTYALTHNNTQALTKDGSLWSWGCNERGAVGDGTKKNRTLPVKILDNVASIEGNGVHNFAIKNDGSLWTWGFNSYGQLGDGTTTDRTTPVKIIDTLYPTANELTSLSIPSQTRVTIGDKTFIPQHMEPVDVDYESMSWNSSDESIATVSPRGVVTGVSIGEAMLTVRVTSKEGTFFERTCTVVVEDVPPVIVTAKDITVEYGEPIPTLHYEVEGELVGQPNLSCGATNHSPVGQYPIVVSQGDVSSDNVTYVNGTLTITPAPLTITAKDYEIRQGEPFPAFEATYSGFKNDETPDVLTKQPTFFCQAMPNSKPGTYELYPTGAEADNYEITYEPGTLTILYNTCRLYVENTSVRCGSQEDIPVFFESETAYGGLQFEVTLPVGITLNKLKKTERLGDDFVLQKSKTGDNTWQILLYNTSQLSFDGNDGALFTMTVDVDNEMEEGDYTMTFSDIVASDVNENRYDLADYSTTIQVEKYMMGKGDLNGDGTVSITDVVLIIDVIAGNITDVNQVAAADVNGDGSVTITDCVAAIDLIAAQQYNGARRAKYLVNSTDFISATLRNNILTMNLNNTNRYTAFQMMVTMPEEMTIDAAKIDEVRGADHQIVVRNLGNGQYLLAGFSINNDELTGNSGNLLIINTHGQVTGEIQISNVEFATIEGKACRLTGLTVSTTTTGISEMTTDNSVNTIYHDLQGRRIVTPVKGLYIVNGKKMNHK